MLKAALQFLIIFILTKAERDHSYLVWQVGLSYPPVYDRVEHGAQASVIEVQNGQHIVMSHIPWSYRISATSWRPHCSSELYINNLSKSKILSVVPKNNAHKNQFCQILWLNLEVPFSKI